MFVIEAPGRSSASPLSRSRPKPILRFDFKVNLAVGSKLFSRGGREMMERPANSGTQEILFQ
uniref:Uncharacterized protein n=1 Tax=Picea glauca TaxID=3330 RepID=A0A117NHA9_PICGL|nr:hypothetical protein ABT39_MTgene5091 [Picea glauca]QHR87720.1 hypothetical protein Q903MT_gene1732 [Picea sitchensis]